MLNIITIIAYITMLLSEILLNRLMRSKSTDLKNKDKYSITFIWLTIAVAISTAVYIANHFYFPLFLDPMFRYIGVAVIFIGIIIRLIAVFSLGKFFTVDVTIRQNHQLKKDGLYAYLRHPSYFASLLSFIGVGITLNNWVSLLVIVFAMLAAFINRMQIEERALIEHFGSEYLKYKKNTKGLIPFIY